MDRIDYNQPGGFGLSTQILDAGQEAYKTFNAYGNMAGDLAIITGCEIGGGGFVTDGFVSIYGELLPFVGGAISTNVAIVETSDLRGFEDGSVKPVIYTRYATFGEATVSYPWDNFRRPMTLFQIEDRLNLMMKANPVGEVKVWGRPEDEIPEFHIPYEPLQGKVPIGHLPGHPIFGNLNSAVGVESITLTTENLPPLNASIIIAPNEFSAGHNLYGRGGNSGTIQLPVKSGPASPITNIQPSRIVDFIQFVGFD